MEEFYLFLMFLLEMIDLDVGDMYIFHHFFINFLVVFLFEKEVDLIDLCLDFLCLDVLTIFNAFLHMLVKKFAELGDMYRMD